MASDPFSGRIAGGLTHNVSVAGDRVVVRSCSIHDAFFGWNFHSRARFNELCYNWIADGWDGEVAALDGKLNDKVHTGLANSSLLMVGNVVISTSRPDASGPAVRFGADAADGPGHDGVLFLANNTFVAGSKKTTFMELASAKARLTAVNNIFAGSDAILSLAQPAVSIDARYNLVGATANVPAEFKGTVKGDPMFLDPERGDFRLRPKSPAVDAGTTDLRVADATGSTRTVPVLACPWPNLAEVPRKMIGRPDLGAYELRAAPASQPEKAAGEKPRK